MSDGKNASGRAPVRAAVDGIFAVEPLEQRRLLSASLAKIGDVLGFLATDFSTRPEAGMSRSVIRNKPYVLAAKQPNADLVRTDGDTVLVKAVATATKRAGALAAELAAIGATVTASYGPMLTAAVPVSKLASLANLSGLNYADASYAPMTSAGRTDDYGVQAMNADKGQHQYAVDGTGVTVGVLSDSFGTRTTSASTVAQDIASGDLPAAGVNVLKDYATAGTDEGRAMAQIVHDVAPGSPIAFYSAFNSEPDFAAGIVKLAQPVGSGGGGAKVIVDDVFYLDEPFFQDGIVGQAVNTAYNTYGASYFSSAGNYARNAYENSFNPTASINTTALGTGVFQDFDTSAATNIYQQITIPASGNVRFTMQWNAPYASASSNAGGSASPTNSVAAYVLDSSQSSILASSVTSKVGGDPYQIVSYTNPSTTTAITAFVAFKVTNGAAPTFIKYVNFGSATINTFATNTGASFGHSMATGAQGVAAAYYVNTPAFNVSPALKESFTSAGGTAFRFNPNGTPISGGTQVRLQPALTGPDGAATTFFSSQNNGLDGQYHFFGTSSAAPHVAGVAALMLQAKPTLTNAQVYSTLQTTAVDMLSAGYDFDTGYGLVDANAALTSVAQSSITGNVYRDLNNNGVKDGSDTAVSGQTVFLDSNNNGLIDTGTTTLNASPALAIPDGAANAPSKVATSIVSSVTGRVTGLTVSLNATHSWASDLGFTLITPSGVRIPLSTVIGGANGHGTGYSLTYSDAAATYVQAVSSTTVLTGTYKPQTPLAAAIGESAAGTWQLEARDYFAPDSGTLNSWSLGFTYADPSTTSNASGIYAFNAVTPSAFYGTYRVRVAPLAGYALNAGAAGYDLTLGRSQAAVADFGFAPAATATTFASSVVDDGTAQRSRVRTVAVTFNGTVAAAAIAAGAFTLTQTSGSSTSPGVSSWTVNVTSVTTPAVGQTAVTLSFAGPALDFGSLADGRYTLNVNGNFITATNGLKVDAANSGTAGSSRAINFFRLAQDTDGSAKVDFNDFINLQTSYNTSTGNPSFNAGVDTDNNGTIDFNDFINLQTHYLVTV